MYEVRNDCGTFISEHIGFNAAKLQADTLCEKTKRREHYHVFKVEQVWSSSTLDKADVPVQQHVRADMAEVTELLRCMQNIDTGGYIPALKAYRALTNASLKEAKEAVEKYRYVKSSFVADEGATLGDILGHAIKD